MNHLLILLLTVSAHEIVTLNSHVNIPEDATMTFKQLAQKYTQTGEEYDLIIEGGYILKLFRIPGDKAKPLLFIHGAVDSSDSFIMRGNSSLAIALSRKNYDVWAINLRGNRYSRRHVRMDPDLDKQYWDYSVHEFGYYDLPATIDFILNKTKQEKLSIIGFSEGTTSMYVLGATRPEYNDKVKILISMAPICYMHNARIYMSLLMDIAPVLNAGFIALGAEEFVGYNSLSKSFIDSVCMQKNTGYQACIINGLFLLTGEDAREIEPDFLPVILGHFPAGTSRKNMEHFLQIRSRKTFANYDHGLEGNMMRYNRPTPPEYDLSKVTMKIALLVAKNDRISTIDDVELLRKQLPNVVAYKVMKNHAFNHVDYIWGKSSHKTLFPYIFNLLNKYE